MNRFFLRQPLKGLGKFGIHRPPVETGGYSRSTPTAFSLKFMTFIKKTPIHAVGK
jgi:hypothetical protein